MGNIYVKSCSKDGNLIKEGSSERVFDDATVAQFKNPYFKEALNTANDAYRAISKKEMSNIKLLNVTDKCVVMGGTFKHAGKEFQLNVFKNNLNKRKISSYTQIFPLEIMDGEVYVEAEFRGTEVAKLLERSMEHFMDETLG